MLSAISLSITVIADFYSEPTDIHMERNKWGFLVFSTEHRRKMSEAAMGNENRAKPYPAFVHRVTREVIPAGVNLARMCRERGLTRQGMVGVLHGLYEHHKGWMVLEGDKQ